MRMREALGLLSVCLFLGACASRPGGGSPVSSERDDAEETSPGHGVPTLAELTDNPARLTGTAAGEVKALLGDPDFLRREKPAEVWQYYGRECVLDLFFYGDGAAKSVAYVDLRGRGAAKANDRRCLSSLFEDRFRPTS